jgi:hypothetical protein
MNQHTSNTIDPVRSRLRATLATIQNELNLLSVPGQENNNPEILRVAFLDLVNQLDLGPEPAVRECAFCGHLGRLEAKLCGYCWRPSLRTLPVAMATHVSAAP